MLCSCVCSRTSLQFLLFIAYYWRTFIICYGWNCGIWWQCGLHFALFMPFHIHLTECEWFAVYVFVFSLCEHFQFHSNYFSFFWRHRHIGCSFTWFVRSVCDPIIRRHTYYTPDVQHYTKWKCKKIKIIFIFSLIASVRQKLHTMW